MKLSSAGSSWLLGLLCCGWLLLHGTPAFGLPALEEFKALIGKERDSKDVQDFLSRHQFMEVHRADVLSTIETGEGVQGN